MLVFRGISWHLLFSNFTFEVAFKTGCVQGNPVSKWWNKYCNHDGTFNVDMLLCHVMICKHKSKGWNQAFWTESGELLHVVWRHSETASYNVSYLYDEVMRGIIVTHWSLLLVVKWVQIQLQLKHVRWNQTKWLRSRKVPLFHRFAYLG